MKILIFIFVAFWLFMNIFLATRDHVKEKDISIWLPNIDNSYELKTSWNTSNGVIINNIPPECDSSDKKVSIKCLKEILNQNKNWKVNSKIF